MRHLAILTCLLAAQVSAQMSGTYTVDPAGSGARTFNSLNAASHALATQGVSGAVTIQVADGVYPETWVIAPIPGASATRRVTLRAQNRHQVRLEAPSTGGGARTALEIPDYGAASPVAWIDVEGFHFARTGTYATVIFGINALGNSHDIRIEDCVFEDAEVRAEKSWAWELSHSEWIRGQSRTRIYHSVRFWECERMDIHHCRINTQTVSVELTSRPGASGENRIWNNTFYGENASSGRAMLDLANAHSTIVEHNTFAPQGPQYGAVCLRVGGLFARPVVFRNNIFHNPWPAARHPIELGNPSPYFVQSANNLYHAPSAVDLFRSLSSNNNNGSGIAKDLATLQQTTGLETGSLQVDPKLIQNTTLPFDLHPLPDSPAIARARNTSAFIVDDLDGAPRFAKATIGAYEGAPPLRFQSFGSGCAGSGAQVPVIGSAGQHAYGSKDFRITLSKALGAFGLQAILALGRSKSNWAGVPLPISLGGNCQLLVSPDLLLPAGISGGTGPGLGTASFNLLVPLDPRLEGLQFHFQWAVPDPQAKGIGLAFSDAATISF